MNFDHLFRDRLHPRAPGEPVLRRQIAKRLREAVCLLLGHKRRLHVGDFGGWYFGIDVPVVPIAPASVWRTCDRCKRFLGLVPEAPVDTTLRA